MQIYLTADDPALLQTVAAELAADLRAADLQGIFSQQLLTEDGEPLKGDLVSLGTIVLTAVGTGGVLTVAVQQLANIIAVWQRKVDITLETKDGRKIALSGPARDIQEALRQVLQQENQQ